MRRYSKRFPYAKLPQWIKPLEPVIKNIIAKSRNKRFRERHVS